MLSGEISQEQEPHRQLDTKTIAGRATRTPLGTSEGKHSQYTDRNLNQSFTYLYQIKPSAMSADVNLQQTMLNEMVAVKVEDGDVDEEWRSGLTSRLWRVTRARLASARVLLPRLGP